MYTKWYRYGNFTESHTRQGYIDHHVSYLPDSDTAVIIRIDVNTSYPLGGQPLVWRGDFDITFSPHFNETIVNLSKKLDIKLKVRNTIHNLFDKDSTEVEGKAYQASVKCYQVALLIQFMQHFELSSNEKLFPPELIGELLAIANTKTIIDAGNFQHLLQPRHTVNRVRNLTAEEKELVFMFQFLPYAEKHIKYLSENFNRFSARHEVLRLALMQAIVYQPIEAVALLLWYKAPPFKRDIDWGDTPSLLRNLSCEFDFGPRSGANSASAFELALMFDQKPKLDLITIESSKPIKPPASKQIMYDSGFENDLLTSHFLLVDGTKIKTCLKLVSALTIEEITAIHTLFKKTFASLDGEKDLKNEFNLEFLSFKNRFRLIDLIYARNKLIGFALVEIIKPKPEQFKKHIFVYGAYSAIDKEYQRNLGLMPILIFRVAYSLKQLYPDCIIGVLYIAIHYNSYRLANQLYHWPKHQDDETTKLAENLLDMILPVGYSYVHNNLLTYVEQPIIVIPNPDDTANAPIWLDEQMFNQAILGQGSPNLPAEKKRRSPPILFTIDSETRTLTEDYAKRIGLNFQNHIQNYANKLADFMRQHQINIKESTAGKFPFFRHTYDERDLATCINLTKPKL